MAVTITIGGTDRTEFWKRERTNFEVITNGRGKASGIVFDVPVGDAFRPVDGQVVVISEDATVRYRGILLEPEEERIGDRDSNDLIRFDCAANDYNAIADRRVVAAEYENTAFESIVADIVTNYLSGEGITTTNVETGAAISKVTFNYVTVRDAFNQLSEITGKAWYIDADKDLHFKDLTSDPAPATLDGDIALMDTVRVRPDRQKYRNREYVLAGTEVFPIVAIADDSAEQTARATLEGTSGIYEHVVQADDITSGEVALEYGEDLLERFAAVTKVIEFETQTAGFEAGQSGTANFPEHNVSSETVFIEEVNGFIHEELDEVWYSVRAITGDPFGSWMEHFRKDERNKHPFQIGPPTPGEFDLVAIEPGPLVHDPPPGTGDWFQAAASGTLDSTPSAVGILHTLGSMVTVRRGPVATPRQTIMEWWDLDANNVPSTTPDASASWDELVAGPTFKDVLCVSPDSQHVAFIHYDPGGDNYVGIVSRSGGLLGTAVVTLGDQANGGEPVWIGNHIYWPNVSDGAIHVIDATDPSSPSEVQVFSSSLSAVNCIISNLAGTYAFATGDSANLVISLDLSSPAAITEADTQVTTGDYRSLGINNNNLLIMFQRASAATVRWCAIDIGAAGALSLNTESTLTLATNEMDGYTTVAGGDRCITFESRTTQSSVNSLSAHVFNIGDPSAVTLVETLDYNHALTGNSAGARTDDGLAVLRVFGFNTDAQVTYAEISYPDVVPITIDRPLRAGFGGTGLDEYATGDIIYAAEVLPTDNRFNGALSRLAIGLDGQFLLASGGVPQWGDAPAGVPGGCASGELLVCSGGVPAWAAQSFVQHNNLGGLTTGDPHTQYVPADGSRPFTGTIDAGGQGIDNAPFFRGYIDGLVTELGSDADHDITVCPGVCTDSLADNDRAVILEAAITKQIDATFAEGNNAGGMATGSVAADTEYNLIVITKDADGTVDVCFDTDPGGANAPSGWTARRRILSVFTDGSSNILAYTQTGDRVEFEDHVRDVLDSTVTEDVYETGTLTVPAGMVADVVCIARADLAHRVNAKIRQTGSPSTTGNVGIVHVDALANTDIILIGSRGQITVDENSQVEYAVSGVVGGGSESADLFVIDTIGWTDDRGRNFKASEEVEMVRFNVEELINNGSGVTRATAHASMNLDACAFRFGSVQDRSYVMAKLPESFVGKECHAVAVLSHSSASITGTGDDMIKLEVGYGLVDQLEAIPNLGTVNDGTAPVDVDIDHEFITTQYGIVNLQLATFTPVSDERVLALRLTRDGTEETSDGSRLAANLHCHGIYVIPVADDAGGYTVPDTVT